MLIYYLSSLIFSNFEFLFLTCAKPDWRNEKVKGEIAGKKSGNKPHLVMQTSDLEKIPAKLVEISVLSKGVAEYLSRLRLVGGGAGQPVLRALQPLKDRGGVVGVEIAGILGVAVVGDCVGLG